MLKPTLKGDPEIIETCRFTRVITWYEMDSLLLHCDCCAKIGKVTETLKPASERVPRLLDRRACQNDHLG